MPDINKILTSHVAQMTLPTPQKTPLFVLNNKGKLTEKLTEEAQRLLVSHAGAFNDVSCEECDEEKAQFPTSGSADCHPDDGIVVIA